MKKITKKAFVEYLENLPPTKSFCRGRNCPLMQFYSDKYPKENQIQVGSDDYGSNDTEAVKSPLWIKAFVDMVDSRRTGWWNDVTPTNCLEDLKNVSKYY